MTCSMVDGFENIPAAEINKNNLPSVLAFMSKTYHDKCCAEECLYKNNDDLYHMLLQKGESLKHMVSIAKFFINEWKEAYIKVSVLNDRIVKEKEQREQIMHKLYLKQKILDELTSSEGTSSPMGDSSFQYSSAYYNIQNNIINYINVPSKGYSDNTNTENQKEKYKELYFLERNCDDLEYKNKELIRIIKKLWSQNELSEHVEAKLMDDIFNQLVQARGEIEELNAILARKLNDATELQVNLHALFEKAIELEQSYRSSLSDNALLQKRIEEGIDREAMLNQEIETLHKQVEEYKELVALKSQTGDSRGLSSDVQSQKRNDSYEQLPSLISELEQAFRDKYESKPGEHHFDESLRHHEDDHSDIKSFSATFGDRDETNTCSTRNMVGANLKVVKSAQGSELIKQWTKLAVESKGLNLGEELLSNENADDSILSMNGQKYNRSGARVVTSVNRMQLLKRKAMNDSGLKNTSSDEVNISTSTRVKPVLSRLKMHVVSPGVLPDEVFTQLSPKNLNLGASESAKLEREREDTMSLLMHNLEEIANKENTQTSSSPKKEQSSLLNFVRKCNPFK